MFRCLQAFSETTKETILDDNLGVRFFNQTITPRT